MYETTRISKVKKLRKKNYYKYRDVLKLQKEHKINTYCIDDELAYAPDEYRRYKKNGKVS